ncbi:glycosyltransferase family 2 protein [Empedobacter sp.]|uniref:glycosyltransferase family 2 protein n=1 Tax=Empedobacter sp. TaxID=1927715 RepID=UPI0028B1941E|nr:glycosyltransferase family 2 protein [Empedobacter sp.]
MVAILLSTYNGEKFLQEQLDSILNQTFNDWKLYIRDDGSLDNTLNILNEYYLKFPNKIEIINNSGEYNLGAAKSFIKLLQRVEANYYMFCDQDDYWLSNKIELMFNKMKVLEEKSNSIPILINSDLFVVDSKLNILNESFWKYTNLDPYKISIEFLEVTNCVTGCATFFNKKARDIAIKDIEDIDIIMHDYWLPICIKGVNGLIYPIKDRTIYYRQHDNNVIGAGNGKMSSLMNKFLSIYKNLSYNKRLFNMVNRRINISIYSFILKKIKLYKIRKMNHG